MLDGKKLIEEVEDVQLKKQMEEDAQMMESVQMAPGCHKVQPGPVSVTLTRSLTDSLTCPFFEEAPWGMVWDAKSLQLTDLDKGSIASDSAVLRGCLGMTLFSINHAALPWIP